MVWFFRPGGQAGVLRSAAGGRRGRPGAGVRLPLAVAHVARSAQPRPVVFGPEGSEAGPVDGPQWGVQTGEHLT
jgi:hypothetical protein